MAAVLPAAFASEVFTGGQVAEIIRLRLDRDEMLLESILERFRIGLVRGGGRRLFAPPEEDLPAKRQPRNEDQRRRQAIGGPAGDAAGQAAEVRGLRAWPRLGPRSDGR